MYTFLGFLLLAEKCTKSLLNPSATLICNKIFHLTFNLSLLLSFSKSLFVFSLIFLILCYFLFAYSVCVMCMPESMLIGGALREPCHCTLRVNDHRIQTTHKTNKLQGISLKQGTFLKMKDSLHCGSCLRRPCVNIHGRQYVNVSGRTLFAMPCAPRGHLMKNEMSKQKKKRMDLCEEIKHISFIFHNFHAYKIYSKKIWKVFT